MSAVDQPGSRPRPAARSSSWQTFGAAGVAGGAGERGNCRTMQADCFSSARRGRPIAWRSSNRLTCANGMAASCLHAYWLRETDNGSVTKVTFTANCRRGTRALGGIAGVLRYPASSGTLFRGIAWVGQGAVTADGRFRARAPRGARRKRGALFNMRPSNERSWFRDFSSGQLPGPFQGGEERLPFAFHDAVTRCHKVWRPNV
jgi:hypothetical protein